MESLREMIKRCATCNSDTRCPEREFNKEGKYARFYSFPSLKKPGERTKQEEKNSEKSQLLSSLHRYFRAVSQMTNIKKSHFQSYATQKDH